MFETAPLGALIRFSNGEPQPPVRFTRKLRAWEKENGVGRLVKKEPGIARERYTIPPSLTLHAGDYRSAGFVAIVVNLIFHVGSRLDFTIAERPAPGMALVLTSFEGVDTLRHLATDRAAAERWLSEHHWSNARIEIVTGDAATACLPVMEQAA
jgi:hypothetical protein